MPTFGPVTRTTHPGVPADHFAPVRNRWRTVDHRGRVTALVADGPTAEERQAALRVLTEAMDATVTTDSARADLGLEMAGNHDSFTGTHSHPHSAFGQQGDDATHDHPHSHDGDAVHGHTHAAAAETCTCG